MVMMGMGMGMGMEVEMEMEMVGVGGYALGNSRYFLIRNIITHGSCRTTPECFMSPMFYSRLLSIVRSPKRCMSSWQGLEEYKERELYVLLCFIHQQSGRS